MTAYHTTTWQTARRRQLTAMPYCATCGAPATVADHTTARRALVDQGTPNPDDPAFLQSLCEHCHNSKTARHDGGFGRFGRPTQLDNELSDG